MQADLPNHIKPTNDSPGQNPAALRVLVLPSWYPPNGGEFFRDHALAMANQEINVQVMALLSRGLRDLLPPDKAFQQGRFRVMDQNPFHHQPVFITEYRKAFLRFPLADKANILAWISTLLQWFDQWLESHEKPDLIHVHSAIWAGVAAARINEKHGIPYIITEHRSRFIFNTPEARSLFQPWHYPLLREAFQRAARIVTVSHSLQDKISAISSESAPRLSCIANMTDTRYFHPPRQKPAGETFCFFSLGHLEDVKGMDTLIRAMAILKKEFSSDCRLIIGGRGSREQALKQLCHNLGLSENIQFTGALSREQVRMHLQQAHAFVLPSRYEAFGVVYIEAMACGLPVIATRAGGPPDFLDPRCGLLVDPGQPEALAQNMHQLQSHYDSYDKEFIRQYTHKHFGREAISRQYADLYETVLSKPMHFEPVQNDAYPWHRHENIFFKGFCIYRNHYLNAGRAALMISAASQPGELQALLAELDGCFALIVQHEGALLAAVDAMSSFSLFYGITAEKQWLISDCSYHLRKKMGNPPLNTGAFDEFSAAGFVLGNESLIRGLYRIPPGQMLQIMPGRNPELRRWHDFLPKNQKWPEDPEKQLINQLEKSGQRLLGSIKNETLVVPLSGGFDSRLIVCMLKKAGYEKVICLTYGAPNPESQLSERVAKTLGYRWIFVDYTRLNTRGFSDHADFEAWQRYAGNHVSMPYLQEYFAVKHLKETKLIPDNSIFLPGHSGDFLAGSYVEKTARSRAKNQQLYRHIARHYFWFYPLNRKKLRHISQRISQHMQAFLQPPARAHYRAEIENWDVHEKLAKFVFHSALVFPFFGYGFRFPLWDKPLRDFFRELPWELRSGKALYDQSIIRHYFKPLGVYFGQDELPGNRPGDLSPEPRPKPNHPAFALKRRINAGKILRGIIPPTLVPGCYYRKKRRPSDYICYERFSRELKQKMRSQPELLRKKFRSYNALLCDWYLYQISSNQSDL